MILQTTINIDGIVPLKIKTTAVIKVVLIYEAGFS